MTNLLVSLALLMGLVGCSSLPRLERAVVPAPESDAPPRTPTASGTTQLPDWWTVGPNVVIALLTVGLFAVAYRQWRTSTDQAAAMQEDLRLTRESNEIAGRGAATAERSSMLLERAEIRVDLSFRPPSAPEVLVLLVSNRGRSRAEIKEVNFQLHSSLAAPLPETPTYEGGIGRTVSGAVDPNDSLSFEFWFHPQPSAVEAMMTGKARAGVWGYVAFRDVFGSERRSYFGFEYQPRMKRFALTDRPGFNLPG